MGKRLWAETIMALVALMVSGRMKFWPI